MKADTYLEILFSQSNFLPRCQTLRKVPIFELLQQEDQEILMEVRRARNRCDKGVCVRNSNAALVLHFLFRRWLAS